MTEKEDLEFIHEHGYFKDQYDLFKKICITNKLNVSPFVHYDDIHKEE